MTLALAVYRKFPWRKVPVYIISQIAGAFFGALISYGNYYHAIDAYEGKGVRNIFVTGNLFATYPVCVFTLSERSEKLMP